MFFLNKWWGCARVKHIPVYSVIPYTFYVSWSILEWIRIWFVLSRWISLSFRLNGEHNFISMSIQSTLFSASFQYLANFAISNNRPYSLGSDKPNPPLSFGAHSLLNLILALFPSHKHLTISSYLLKMADGIVIGNIVTTWLNWGATIILIILTFPHSLSLNFFHLSKFVLIFCKTGLKFSVESFPKSVWFQETSCLSEQIRTFLIKVKYHIFWPINNTLGLAGKWMATELKTGLFSELMKTWLFRDATNKWWSHRIWSIAVN